jgi:hypothetical protein
MSKNRLSICHCGQITIAGLAIGGGHRGQQSQTHWMVKAHEEL